MKDATLKSFRLRNFKAVRDSKVVRFTPLTVFIGNNGSGKSSIIEGLATYQMIVMDGLDDAMNYWRGFEHIRNLAVPHPSRQAGVERPYEMNPIEFQIQWQNWRTEMVVAIAPSGDELFIQKESLAISSKVQPKAVIERNDYGEVSISKSEELPRKLGLKPRPSRTALLKTLLQYRCGKFSTFQDCVDQLCLQANTKPRTVPTDDQLAGYAEESLQLELKRQDGPILDAPCRRVLLRLKN